LFVFFKVDFLLLMRNEPGWNFHGTCDDDDDDGDDDDDDDAVGWGVEGLQGCPDKSMS
jgi:hypothetical protein